MKLRKSACSFKPSSFKKSKSIEGVWNFDKSFNNCGKLQEFSSVNSRPSGKGRFGKRAISFPIEQGGHSNDSNSNDSGVGIDLHSSESQSQSQLSWCSEDSYLGSFPISNATVPQFPGSERKELFNNSVSERPPINVSFNTRAPVGSVFDTNSAKLLLPEKAQLVSVSENMRMSPDSTETPFQLLGNQETSNPLIQSISSPNSSSSPTSTMSPVPIKRSRFNYPNQNQLSGKGAGLKLRNQNQNGRSIGTRLPPGTIPTLTSSLSSTSRDGRVQLQIVSQPEEQHRARYQTEGSRGAIKDRKGNGFPTVKLVGYDKPATLQIFIGTDQGKVSPHMFYQACKVTGKSSTPCIEKKIEGTIVIEIEFEPSKDSVISCDCVGILKERNVDVEQRFPFHHASQSRKKSTKCRMIYRTTIMNSSGVEETLQVSSLPILCTQPPGLPEICKQSLFECPGKGGLELFVIGKNFLKDTSVIFQEEDNEGRTLWEATSEPLKDYLQQNHLICVVPPFKDQSIASPVDCKVVISSGGKQSEPHRFTYLPNLPPVHYGIPSTCVPNSQAGQSQERMMRTLSGGKHMLAMDIQALEPLVPADEASITNVTSPIDVLSSSRSPNTMTSAICQSSVSSVTPVNTLQPLERSSSLDQIPALSFPNIPNNIIPSTTAQERQVVSELQCILDQSMQQNQHEKSVSEILSTTNVMSIKPETTFSSMDISMTTSSIAPSSVPLDLQFPTEGIQSIRTVNFTDHTISNPQYSTVQNLNCMAPDVSSQLLTRTTSMELNAEQKLLTELLPGSEALVSVPNTLNSSIAGAQTIAMSSAASTDMTMSMSVNVPEMSVASCISSGIIKSEPGTMNTGLPTTSNSIAVNSITVSNPIQPQQQSSVVSMAVSSGNYIVGDLQGHQGNITNAITQMSDSELINYINPVCFEQNLM